MAVKITFPAATLADANVFVRELRRELVDLGIPAAEISIQRSHASNMDLGALIEITWSGIQFLAEVHGTFELGRLIYNFSRRVRSDAKVESASPDISAASNAGNASSINDVVEQIIAHHRAKPTTRHFGLIFLGASKFTYKRDLNRASFATSKERIASVLTQDNLLADSVHRLDLFDLDMPPSQLVDHVHSFLSDHSQLTDVIIYYCGHGSFLPPDRTYYLMLRSTKPDREANTGLQLRQFQIDLDDALRDKRTFLILDCCYAAAALRDWMSDRDVAGIIGDQVEALFPPHGAALLAAASRTSPAIAPEDRETTLFSGHLAEVIRQGVPIDRVQLTLADIAESVRKRIRKEALTNRVLPELHSPRQTQGDVSTVPLVLNRFQSKPQRPPVLPAEPDAEPTLAAAESRIAPAPTEEATPIQAAIESQAALPQPPAQSPSETLVPEPAGPEQQTVPAVSAATEGPSPEIEQEPSSLAEPAETASPVEQPASAQLDPIAAHPGPPPVQPEKELQPSAISPAVDAVVNDIRVLIAESQPPAALSPAGPTPPADPPASDMAINDGTPPAGSGVDGMLFDAVQPPGPPSASSGGSDDASDQFGGGGSPPPPPPPVQQRKAAWLAVAAVLFGLAVAGVVWVGQWLTSSTPHGKSPIASPKPPIDATGSIASSPTGLAKPPDLPSVRASSCVFTLASQDPRLGGPDAPVRIQPNLADAKPLHAVAMSPDGMRFATAGYDGIVRLWSTSTFQPQPLRPKHEAEVFSVSFSSDSSFVASAGRDGMVRVWSTSSGSLVHEFPVKSDRESIKQYGVALFPGTPLKYVNTAGDDGFVQIWEVGKGAHPPRKSIHAENSDPAKRVIRSISIPKNSSGEYATAGFDGKIDFVQNTRKSIPIDAFSGKVLSVAFSPDGSRIAAAGADNKADNVKVWKVGSKTPTVFKGHAKYAVSVAWSPDGDQILSGGGGADPQVRLWNVNNGQLVRSFAGHAKDIEALAFYRGKSRIISVSEDGTLKLWDTEAKDPLILTAMAFGDSGDYVVYAPNGCYSGSAKIERRLAIESSDGGRTVSRPVSEADAKALHSPGYIATLVK